MRKTSDREQMTFLLNEIRSVLRTQKRVTVYHDSETKILPNQEWFQLVTRDEQWSCFGVLVVDTQYELDSIVQVFDSANKKVNLLNLNGGAGEDEILKYLDAFAAYTNARYVETDDGAIVDNEHFLVVIDHALLQQRDDAYTQTLISFFDQLERLLYLKLALHEYGRHKVAFYLQNINFLYEFGVTGLFNELGNMADRLFADYQFVYYFDAIAKTLTPVVHKGTALYSNDPGCSSDRGIKYKIRFMTECDLKLQACTVPLTDNEQQELAYQKAQRAAFTALLASIHAVAWITDARPKFKVTWTTVGKLLTGAVLAAILFDVQPFGVIYNDTPSMPKGWYLTEKIDATKADLRQGDLVLFQYPEPMWAYGRYLLSGPGLLKQVYAVPGDKLESRGDEVYRCTKIAQECQKLNTVHRVDSEDRPMYPIMWNTVIPRHYFYVSTEYEKSLNSNYYGLISDKQITHTAKYLF